MKQISIVSEDRPNLIAEIIEAVGRAGVNIESFDSEVIHGTVVAIMTVDHYDDALRVLAQSGFAAISEDALLIRLDDRPGALAAVAHRFKEANIPLRSVRIVRRSGGSGIIALTTARTDEALALVKDVLIA
jgi:hypothetical protein